MADDGLPASCPPDLIRLAHHLADVARPIARQYFQQEQQQLEIKADATPVTLADRAIETAWRDIVMARYPGHGIWGEEFGRYQPDSDYQWIFDPIDGTHAFATGRTSFGCLIALHHVDQGFILGICDQPITDERWVGAMGRPTTYNDTALPLRDIVKPPLRASITNPMRLNPLLTSWHDSLRADNAVIVYGGNCLNFAAIAQGLLDVSFETRQSLYDVAAFVPILAGTGSVITQTDGRPIDLEMGDAIIACATPELHRQFAGNDFI